MNKIIRGIIPALLITLPIGSVYAFSLFSTDISTYINCSFKEIQFAFSLSIFFLGMGAAFGGSIVEKNINKSALLASGLFCVGLIITSIGISLHNIWFIYVGYGFLCGIAQGIGYLTPVKTLLMWFPKNKGLATSISIISFGLGSGLCTILHNYIYPYTGINNIFYVLSVIYFIMMVVGAILIKKPYIEQKTTISNTNFNYKIIFKDKFFILSWLFMFLNISAGLSLIGSSVNIFKELNTQQNIIVLLMLLAGIFNGGFRLVFAWISDLLNNRRNIWIYISVLSIILMLLSSIIPQTLVITIILINACYGGGFSTIPSILSERYDLNCLSRVHGLVLSAWGIAGLIGNNISTLLYSLSGSFLYIPVLLTVIYIINLFISLTLRKISLHE